MAGEEILWGIAKYHKTKGKLLILIFRTRRKAQDYKKSRKPSKVFSYGNVVRMKGGPDNV